MLAPEITHTESVACEITADLKNVSKVARLLKHFCQSRGLDETLWPSIELAFCEGLNNAIEHGCEYESSKKIRISWQWIESKLQIQIEDPSSYVPDTEKSKLPEDLLADSGRGSFIIDSIFDSSIHKSTRYGHLLSLEKDIHQPLDMLVQMQEMYESLQSLTSEMSTCINKAEILKSFSHSLASAKSLEKLFNAGAELLSSVATVNDISFWSLADNMLTSVFNTNTTQPNTIDLSHDSNHRSAFEADRLSLLEKQRGDEVDFQILAPVQFQESKTGLFSITLSGITRRFLEDQILDLIVVFSNNIGIAQNQFKLSQNKEYTERENAQLEIASEIQKSLLPSKFPNNAHCRMTGKCVTAMAVGGDYIDTIEVKDQGILIVIADVMGKGVPAALLATIFRTAIRSRLNLAETPGWLLSKINKQIHEELGHLNMFITAQAAFYTYDKKILKLASAGHCPALLLNQSDQTVSELSAEGIPLGIDANDIYEEKLFNMSSGDRVLFFTDGLYEVENNHGEMLGIDRLSLSLRSLWSDGLESLPTRAFRMVSEFSSENTLQDDQTLMGLEIL